MNLKGMFRKIIDDNDKLYIMEKCIRNRNAPDFIKLIKGYCAREHEYASILITHNGMKFSDSVVYHITIYKRVNKENAERETGGFCAVLRGVLQLLDFSDFIGMIPVVDWGNTAPYYDPGMDSITTNVFEYYFEPVSRVDYREIKDCRNVVESYAGHASFYVRNPYSYELEQNDIERLGGIYKKYIHLNKNTREYIEENLNGILSYGRILAVHVRGTDFNWGSKNHPKIITPEEYLTEVKKIYSHNKYDKVFLATDDENALELFEREFKDTLLYYKDAFRSKDHIGAQNTLSERVLHHYKLGLEVLRDVYTLASCNSLVCGLSQVSFAARYVNIALNRTFEEIVVLDNGINEKDNIEAKRLSRQLKKRNKAEGGGKPTLYHKL